MRAGARAAAGDPALWRPAAFAVDEGARALRAVERALRDLRALWRSSPEGAAEATIAWMVAVPAALAEVSDPEGTLARRLGRGLDDLCGRLVALDPPLPRRAAWLDRLWPPLGADEREWLAAAADAWGPLAGPALGPAWTERLLPDLQAAWSDGRDARWGRAALSLLLAAGRHRELLALLELRPVVIWAERRYGVLARAALGDVDGAIALARESNLLGHPHAQAIAELSEAVLLAAGRRDEAYRDHAFAANQRQNYLQTFRALTHRYPERDPATILADLIAQSPGDEGRWFATARSLRFFNLALEIAERSPCDPRTLSRAAAERLDDDPAFALAVALAALRWIVAGHGHAIDGADVFEAFDLVREAASRLGVDAAARADVLRICEGSGEAAAWVRAHLELELEGGG
ncbi:MAG: hypothetical protein H6711_17700 [Myxococcales bacterium]|nr:hypothetical protein [Myxococcales bacterium]